MFSGHGTRPGTHRRRGDARVLELRHRLYSRAILLDYGALFSFVLTSLLWLGQAFLPISTVVPVVTFGVGVLLLAGLATT
jgi:hypothetical protein